MINNCYINTVNKAHKNPSDSGFTLVELLLYMGIFSILLAMLTQIFISSLNVQLETQAVSSVEQDTKFMVNRMMYDIQQASSITVPAALSAQGDTLKLVVNGKVYTYSPVGTDLILDIDGVASKVNSFDTNISNVIFQRLGNVGGENSIKVGFTATSKVKRTSGPEIRNVETVLSIRPN